jgi:hypothetical protein
MFYLVLAVKRAAITFILLAAFVPKLIHVAATGGKPVLVTEGGIEYARYNAAGNQIVFKTAKGTKMPYVNTTPAA